jgi:HSP20 family protein
VEICDQPQSPFVTATFELPGLKKEEIGVHLTHDGRLTISGDRRPPPFLTNTDATFVVYPVKEIKYGRFERTINVPPGLEVKDINASLADGMLCVSWPRNVSPSALLQGPTQVISMA